MSEHDNFSLMTPWGSSRGHAHITLEMMPGVGSIMQPALSEGVVPFKPDAMAAASVMLPFEDTLHHVPIDSKPTGLGLQFTFPGAQISKADLDAQVYKMIPAGIAEYDKRVSKPRAPN